VDEWHCHLAAWFRTRGQSASPAGLIQSEVGLPSVSGLSSRRHRLVLIQSYQLSANTLVQSGVALNAERSLSNLVP